MPILSRGKSETTWNEFAARLDENPGRARPRAGGRLEFNYIETCRKEPIRHRFGNEFSRGEQSIRSHREWTVVKSGEDKTHSNQQDESDDDPAEDL